MNDGPELLKRTLDFSAFGNSGGKLEVWTLGDRRSAGEPDVTNSFAEPKRVTPVRAAERASSPRITHSFPPYSLTVLRWRAGGQGKG